MNEWRERIRSRLDELKAAGVSRESVAETAGVTMQALSNWANGHREPRSVSDWRRLAGALQVQPAWLAFGDGERDMEPLPEAADTDEMKQAHRAIVDAYRRLPEPAKQPVRALIESLTVAFDPTYHAYIEGVIEHQNNHRAAKSPKEKT